MRPVFLHGWGQSARIWSPVAEFFPDGVFLNLPGHGGAAPAPAEAWPARLASLLPEGPLCLVGWSLGGALAVQVAAMAPERVRALALVSATPRFCMTGDWPHGCDPALLAGFRRALEADDARLAGRFFLLMLRGSGLSRPEMQALSRTVVDKAQPPSREALEAGLFWLEQADWRAQARETMLPALVVHGRGDAVVPEGAGRWLAETLPQGRLAMIGGGHAPFLADPAGFARALHVFLDEMEGGA